jgi:hypothetical protein
VAEEVTPAGLGHLEVGTGTLLNLGAGNLISLTLTLASHVGLDILVGLLDIAGDVKGVAGGLRDGETVWVPRMLAHVTDMHAKREAKKLDHLQ